ncbi:unnamed protein product, partial [Taenia asiatica]|uniref:Fucosyltransferase n=1 Tax=Taenia asiatica TaxID=60517 RepID=A0A0R3VZ84_TAEAS
DFQFRNAIEWNNPFYVGTFVSLSVQLSRSDQIFVSFHILRLNIPHKYVALLAVDVYGRYGKQFPPNVNSFHFLSLNYKFYLAFENSNCRDYITEKVYVNAFQDYSGLSILHHRKLHGRMHRVWLPLMTSYTEQSKSMRTAPNLCLIAKFWKSRHHHYMNVTWVA